MHDIMAATGQRLYPSLPRVSAMLSASSGEEEEDDDYAQNEDERDPRDYYDREDDSQEAGNERDDEVTSSSTNRGGLPHSAISLTEFEQDYFRGSSSPIRRSILSGGLVPRKQQSIASLRKHDVGVVSRCGQYWRGSLVTVCFVLGALCAMQQDGAMRDNFLPCPQPADLPCIKAGDLPLTLNALEHVRKLLQGKSAELGCAAQSNVTIEELKESLKKSGVTLTVLEMSRLVRLVVFNPHWGISLLSGDSQTITDWKYGITSSDVLVDVYSTKGAWCWAWLTVSSLWNYLQSVVIVLLLIVIVIVSVKWYIHRQHEELQSVFILVDKILEVLREHRKKCQQDKDLLPYVAIIHVRDMLIVPSERHRKHRLWRKAVQWVAAHESRVRVETRRIAGEDFTVWRWIQDDPPPTEEPQKLPTVVVPSNGESWQGKAFAHQSSGSPSPCVRLKNMFEPVKKMEEGQVKELMNAVLVRCCAHGGVVHIYVDKRSTFGCIYLKMESNKAATAAYNQLHGSWFKGRLVTAKYIPEPKYYKWFPLAANAKTFLSPSFSEEK